MSIYNELTGGYEKMKEESKKNERYETYDVYIQFDDDTPILAFPMIPNDDSIIFELNALGEDENGKNKNKIYFKDKQTGKTFKMYVKKYKK
jgi:hypothetical protein